MNRNTQIASVVGLAMLVGSGWLLARRYPSAPSAASTAGEAPRYWYDPMHPGQHFDKPGKSPFMDMQLVPKYADPPAAGGEPQSGTIAIDSREVQNLGMRFAQVEQGDFTRVIDAVGSVEVDQHRIEAVQVREPGWVERLDVRAAGDSVRRGQRLAGIYSPALLATQQELLIARDSGDPALVEAARARLSLFGLPARQIARIETTGHAERQVDYFAPFDGYVMELGVRQGAAVEPNTLLFQLADLQTVWLTAEVPEAQAAWIATGNLVDADVPALPGKRFEGHVDYLYPELASATRTLKVRIILDNPTRQLRPGMFATAHLHGNTLAGVLTVPSESVITTGTRRVIVVADDATHFRPVAVRIGAEQGGRSEVLEGLAPGQRVVASGQFLIDSEASLRGAFDRLAGAGGGH